MVLQLDAMAKLLMMMMMQNVYLIIDDDNQYITPIELFAFIYYQLFTTVPTSIADIGKL